MIPLDVPVELGREEARRRVLEELAKTKYEGELPPWLQDLMNRLQDLLIEIVRFVLGLGSPAGAAGGGINIGFVIMVAVIVIGIGLLVWKVGLPRWRRSRIRDADVELDADLAPADYRTAAERFAAAGDWRAAVRDRFRAVVKELEIVTILDPRPARTAFEASTLAGRALPEQASVLRAGAEVFSAVMYGDRAADGSTYRQLVELDRQVTAAAERADLSGDQPEPAEEPR
ncbi:DUF4129 domain-containing protein [Microlunatus speluncae]|uniref:DUF4129 domain-containing protein n=1 Tax=Microlunatus speluncae TaxID=2594267 RepID=UPI0012664354|nr:DUF4129 domain-containing protein [Microlunatus speluncae]